MSFGFTELSKLQSLEWGPLPSKHKEITSGKTGISLAVLEVHWKSIGKSTSSIRMGEVCILLL